MLGKGACGEVNVVGRSEKENSFPRGSGIFFRLQYEWRGKLAKRRGVEGRNTHWKDQETCTPRQPQHQSMNIQHVYEDEHISVESGVYSSLCFSRSNNHPCSRLRGFSYAFDVQVDFAQPLVKLCRESRTMVRVPRARMASSSG